jgi:uncharacterized protein (DUF2235 family)
MTMAKNIILFSDGTGNSAGKLFKTNVWRLYQALDYAGPDPAHPDKPRQLAFYDDGVGTSAIKPLALLGGACGWGLKRNVIDLYTFLCRNYEDGDAIYAFGFSRGAFTIRILLGLIESEGLIQADSEAKLRHLAKDAYRAYRSERFKTLFRLETPMRAIRDGLLHINKRMRQVVPYRRAAVPAVPPIKFVGLWETVDAYGLPIDELTRAWNAVFPLAMPDREMSGNVERLCHALALDDERHTFHPVLFNEETLPGAGAQSKTTGEERLSQVWFSGMHSNVGGGYPDDALARVSLDWIMMEAGNLGLCYKEGEQARVKATMDVSGKMYDSRQGFGGFYRYLPRKIEPLCQDKDNDVFIKRPKIHESVFQRMRYGGDRYAPLGLPPEYAVVTDGGAIVDMPPAAASAVPIEHTSQGEDRAHRQEKIWDLIWQKRLIYFSSIYLALALALFPLYRPATLVCEGRDCFLSPVVGWIGLFLPDLASWWLKAYSSHPGLFFLLLFAVAWCLFVNSRFQIRTFDRMRVLWRPFLDNPGAAVAVSPTPGNFLYGLRTNFFYRLFFRELWRDTIPTALAGIVILLMLAGFTRGLYSIMNAAGLICSSAYNTGQAGIGGVGTFSCTDLCWSSGLAVQQGKRYRITIKMDEKNPWRDDTIATGLGGFGREKMTTAMNPGLAFRRYLREPWFKPIARIGCEGSDEYPLDPVGGGTLGPEARELVAEIKARRSGELFLFVNDAVLPIPGYFDYFYRNNHGKTEVTVARIGR